MNTPKCSTCNDTGRRITGLHDPINFDLDCTDCDVAEQRAALEKWCNETQQRGPSMDDCWAIHQRALAMAPKQEPEPSLLWDAEDPEDGTHASSAEDFARNYAEAAMSKGDVLDVSVLTAVHSRTRTMRIKVKDVDDGEWLEWEWLDGAAPAAANGARADVQAMQEEIRRLRAMLFPEKPDETTGWTIVPLKSIYSLLNLIDPPPVEENGKTMVFVNPHAAEVLTRISAEVRAMMAAKPSIDVQAGARGAA